MTPVRRDDAHSARGSGARELHAGGRAPIVEDVRSPSPRRADRLASLRAGWRSAATIAFVGLAACSGGPAKPDEPFGTLPSAVTTAEPMWIPFSIGAGVAVPDDARETKLASLRQLTQDGKSHGAVWHPDGKSILFTSAAGRPCGELVHLDLATGRTRRWSPDAGWATAAQPFGERVAFLHGQAADCPLAPATLERRLGGFDVLAGVVGGGPQKLVGDASELGAASDGSRLVFTSLRDGDPELYLVNATGGGLTRVTHASGYDGGAALAPNGSRLAWHAERLTDEERPGYAARLEARTVRPSRLHLMVASLAGREPLVIQHGAYAMSPAFLPDSARLLFTSNADDVSSTNEATNFELYLVDPDGPVTATGRPRIDRVTFSEGYDGEGRMSADGKYVVFTSSRGAKSPGQTNVFVARWLGD